MPPTDATPKRRLLELLTGDLTAYVDSRRAAGKSWRQISLDIRDDYDLDITHETLRSWYPDDTRTGDAA